MYAFQPQRFAWRVWVSPTLHIASHVMQRILGVAWAGLIVPLYKCDHFRGVSFVHANA